MSINKNKSASLIIWRFKDGKPGHEKQTQGLIDALSKLRKLTVKNFPCASRFKNISNFIFSSFPDGRNIPSPHILIGAGHATHYPLLTAQKVFGGKSVIIMKPSLPYRMFDLCIIPSHDNPPYRKNIIISEMPLPAHESTGPVGTDRGIFLIGGLSRHFMWNDEHLIDQIERIANDPSNSIVKWKLSTSRRTPLSFIHKLSRKNLRSVEMINHKDTPSSWIDEQLSSSWQTWVTQDSYSMICEAVNACGRVGILELHRKKTILFRSSKKFIKLPDLNLTPFSSWLEAKKIEECNSRNDADQELGDKVLMQLGFQKLPVYKQDSP